MDRNEQKRQLTFKAYITGLLPVNRRLNKFDAQIEPSSEFKNLHTFILVQLQYFPPKLEN